MPYFRSQWLVRYPESTTAIIPVPGPLQPPRPCSHALLKVFGDTKHLGAIFCSQRQTLPQGHRAPTAGIISDDDVEQLGLAPAPNEPLKPNLSSLITEHSFPILLHSWGSVMPWSTRCSNVSLPRIDLFLLVTFYFPCLSSSWILSHQQCENRCRGNSG